MNEGAKTCGRPSRSRYVQGCRCLMCRVANSEYALRQSHGEADAMVGEAETAEARAKVAWWQSHGIGLRSIEGWTGVPRSALQTLVRGNHPNCNGLPRRMSRANYEAIMDAECLAAPGSYVDAAETCEAIAELRGKGMSIAELSRRSSVPASTLYCIAEGRRTQVTRKTANAVMIERRKR